MEDSVFQMQQAARERVRQAHERSRRIIEQNERRPICNPIPEKPKPLPAQPPGAERPDSENEQLLLLLLAFFLYKNGASIEVLLALLYLAL